MIDNEGMVGRFLEGDEVSPETIALDLIHQVGPVPGNYLGTAHTRKWWKETEHARNVADRLTYPEWMRTGKKGALDYARDRMEEILADYRAQPSLSASQEQDIEDILKEARAFYRKQGMISDEEWEVYRKVW